MPNPAPRSFRLLPALALAALLPAAALAVDGPADHRITCASGRVARLYEDGRRDFYQGRLDAAIRDFEEAARKDPACAMAHWGLSRVHRKANRPQEARAAQERAQALAPGADDRERQLIAGLGKLLKADAQPEADRKKALEEVRNDVNRAIALYPEDPEVWILRADVESNPLRAQPFLLAAFRLDPQHPMRAGWKPVVPPLPQLTPGPSKPVSALAEAPPLFQGLGALSHPTSTRNPQAQAYYEQGLRCFHSYVNPGRVKNSAAVNFQHAAALDPEFAMPYWGLSFCPTDAIRQQDAANRALELSLKHGTDRERRFAAARVLELGGGDKREAFLDALDGALAAYPDDVELWTWRGKVYGPYGYGTGTLQGMPFQLAAHRIAPEHPSPNHELVHSYEGIDRPALGWPYTEMFRRSAPNMPHANHMQAHLAMRLGRWQDAIDATRLSRKTSLAGYPELDPSHHIDILIRALGHEGRFKEAEAEPRAYRDGLPWARLLQLKGVPGELEAWAEGRRAQNSPDGHYIGAVVRLDRGDLAGAEPMIANVEEQWKKNPGNLYRYNEVKGRYLVQSGRVEEGLKLLREAAARAVKDTNLHAWGGGSYLLEVWGETALRAHRWDEAEEAYHEALAHEHGSILGALGMQVVWENRNRPELARHYADRARAIWKDADAGTLERQLERVRKLAAGSSASAGRVGGKGS